MMETFRANLLGRRAYRAHAEANRLLDAGKHDQARARFDQALALYDEAARLGCGKAGVQMAYSLILMRYGRLDEAREIMLELQKRTELTAADRKQLRINYAVCQWKLGDLDRAIELMKEAGSAGMTGTIYSTLGLFLIQKAERTGDYAQAAAFIARALEYDDEDAETLDNAGDLHLGLSRRALAEGDAETAAAERRTAADYYDRALAIKPRLITAVYSRARMLHEEGEDDRAAELLERTEGRLIGMLCPVTREQIDALKREVRG